MATLTATRGDANFPVAAGGMAGNKKVAYGTYRFTANPAATTIVEFCRLPRGAVVLDGRYKGAPIDASGGAFDMDIGWANNGVDASDTDGFGNFGVLGQLPITNFRPEVGIDVPFGGILYTTGPQAFAAETKIIGTVNASCTTFASGTVTVMVEYIVP